MGKEREYRRIVFGKRQQGTWIQRGIRTVLFVYVFFSVVFCGCAREQDAPSEDMILRLREAGTMPFADQPSESGTDSAHAEGEDPGKPAEREETPGQCYVYVCGAVCEPGVKKLPEGSRCEDALLAAGGFSESADQTAVNLAALVEDGQQLYFPVLGEEKPGESETDGRININLANVEQLCQLPGIGESRAKAIIRYRETNGKFSEAEELMQVTGIKENIYQNLCDRIKVR